MNPQGEQGNESESGGKPIDSNEPVYLESFVAREEQLAFLAREEQLTSEEEGRDKTYISPPTIYISSENAKEDTEFAAAERAKFKATIASILAISIWIIIGIIVIVHIGSVAWLWSHLPSLIDSTNDAVEKLERASKSIDEIAKTLYTFLGTLATAITGYYFNESAAAERDNSAD